MDIEEAKKIIKNDCLFTTEHELDNNNISLKQAIETILVELENKEKYEQMWNELKQEAMEQCVLMQSTQYIVSEIDIQDIKELEQKYLKSEVKDDNR